MTTLNRLLFDLCLALAIVVGLTWLDNWTTEREARIACEPGKRAYHTIEVMSDTRTIIRCDRRLAINSKGKRK